MEDQPEFKNGAEAAAWQQHAKWFISTLKIEDDGFSDRLEFFRLKLFDNPRILGIFRCNLDFIASLGRILCDLPRLKKLPPAAAKSSKKAPLRSGRSLLLPWYHPRSALYRPEQLHSDDAGTAKYTSLALLLVTLVSGDLPPWENAQPWFERARVLRDRSKVFSTLLGSLHTSVHAPRYPNLLSLRLLRAILEIPGEFSDDFVPHMAEIARKLTKLLRSHDDMIVRDALDCLIEVACRFARDVFVAFVDSSNHTKRVVNHLIRVLAQHGARAQGSLIESSVQLGDDSLYRNCTFLVTIQQGSIFTRSDPKRVGYQLFSIPFLKTPKLHRRRALSAMWMLSYLPLEEADSRDFCATLIVCLEYAKDDEAFMTALQALALLLQRYTPSQEVHAPLEKLLMSRNVATRRFENSAVQKSAHTTVEWLLALVIDIGEFSDGVKSEIPDGNMARDAIKSRYSGFISSFLSHSPCPCAEPTMPTPAVDIKKGLCGLPDDELTLKDMKFPTSNVPRAESWIQDIRKNFPRARQSQAPPEAGPHTAPSQSHKGLPLPARAFQSASASSPHQRGLPPLSPPQASRKHVQSVSSPPSAHVNGSARAPDSHQHAKIPSSVLIPPPFVPEAPVRQHDADLGGVGREPGSPVVVPDDDPPDAMPGEMEPMQRIPSEIEPGSPQYEDLLLAHASSASKLREHDSPEANGIDGSRVGKSQGLSPPGVDANSSRSLSAFDDSLAHDTYKPFVSPKALRAAQSPVSPGASENGVVVSPRGAHDEEKSPFRAKVENGSIRFPFDLKSLRHGDPDLRQKLVAICDVLEDDIPEATLHGFFVGKDIELPAALALLLIDDIAANRSHASLLVELLVLCGSLAPRRVFTHIVSANSGVLTSLAELASLPPDQAGEDSSLVLPTLTLFGFALRFSSVDALTSEVVRTLFKALSDLLAHEAEKAAYLASRALVFLHWKTSLRDENDLSVLKALVRHPQLTIFTETAVQLLNDSAPADNDLTALLKFVHDVFAHGFTDFFYANDTMVMIEILTRRIDNSDEDSKFFKNEATSEIANFMKNSKDSSEVLAVKHPGGVYLHDIPSLLECLSAVISGWPDFKHKAQRLIDPILTVFDHLLRNDAQRKYKIERDAAEASPQNGDKGPSNDDDDADDDGHPRTPYSVEQVEATIMRTIQVLEECEDE